MGTAPPNPFAVAFFDPRAVGGSIAHHCLEKPLRHEMAVHVHHGGPPPFRAPLRLARAR
jgi:hypothetical protein